MLHVKVTSTPVNSSVRVTVRRTTSVTGPTTTTSTSRLSRQSSDVSDVSTTTPITPALAARVHPLHQQRRDNDSSSCSSTEALNQQPEDAWNENPLYADQRRQRRPGQRRTRHAVDTRPLDDLLTDREPFAKSGAELDRSASPPADVNPDPTVPLQMSMSAFKSEPDITAAHNTLIIHDAAKTSELDGYRGSMLDCISVAAPDDTVIKPSQLRASMRQRRTPSLADDASGDAPLRRRGGSLRETRQTSPVEIGTGFVRNRIAINNAASSSASATAAVTSPSTDNGSPILMARSSFSSTHTVPSSGDAPYRKNFQSPVLPNIPRTPAYTVSSAKAGSDSAYEANGVDSLTYDQLLHKFKEVPNIVVSHLECNGLELLYEVGSLTKNL